MSAVKEKKPVWYMTKIEELESKDRLSTHIIAEMREDLKKWDDQLPSLLQQAKDIAMAEGMSQFRYLLATLPLPGVKLLVGLITQAPRIPQPIYDGPDYWWIGIVTTPEDERIIKLTHSKGYTIIKAAQESKGNLEIEYSRALNMRKNAMKGWEAEPEESASKPFYKQRYDELVAKCILIEQQLANLGSVVEDVDEWSIPFSEVA